MSGGSYDYAYQKVDDFAYRLEERNSPLYQSFAKHLHLVAKAMHDIEWVESEDYAVGDDTESIKAVLTPTDVIAGLASSEKQLTEWLDIVRELQTHNGNKDV